MKKRLKDKWIRRKVSRIVKEELGSVYRAKKLPLTWKGHDVYGPCGLHGETVCIGMPICWIVLGKKIRRVSGFLLCEK